MYKNKKFVPFWVCVVSTLSAVVLSVSACFGVFCYQNSWLDGFTKIKLAQIQGLLSENAIYGQTSSALSNALAEACVLALGDPYAAYYSKEEYEAVSQSFEGEYVGVGVHITMHPQNGTVFVSHVHTDSPAYQVGFQRGDEIIAVDEWTIEKDGYTVVGNALGGNIGDQKQITYLRNGEQSTVTITVRSFESQSVFYGKIGDMGYLRIVSFNGNTPEQFSTAIVALQQQGAQGLIFDLRDNGGGVLGAVAKTLDYILPYGDLVSARYANGEEELLYVSDENEVKLPMAVLTNGRTASASELFSAAVRDYNKGVLIGANTYGKGVMQDTIRLFDGSAVKFTSGEFFPPSGEGFNGKGLIPDIPVELTEEQQINRLIVSHDQDPVVQAALQYLSTAKVGD